MPTGLPSQARAWRGPSAPAPACPRAAGRLGAGCPPEAADCAEREVILAKDRRQVLAALAALPTRRPRPAPAEAPDLGIPDNPILCHAEGQWLVRGTP